VRRVRVLYRDGRQFAIRINQPSSAAGHPADAGSTRR
jgi:hypothetical protein